MEQKVVLFLVITFVAGAGIKIARQTWSSAPVFDYRAADSEFIARSQSVDSTDVASTDASARDDTLRRSAVSPPVWHLININTATKSELMSLPGIGDAMAERILDYKKLHGPFASVAALQHVKGIGKKKIERLSTLCTVK